MGVAALVIGILTALLAGIALLELAAGLVFGLTWLGLASIAGLLALYANTPAIVGLVLGLIALHRDKADRIAAWGSALCALTFAPWVIVIGIALRAWLG